MGTLGLELLSAGADLAGGVLEKGAESDIAIELKGGQTCCA